MIHATPTRVGMATVRTRLLETSIALVLFTLVVKDVPQVKENYFYNRVQTDRQTDPGKPGIQ